MKIYVSGDIFLDQKLNQYCAELNKSLEWIKENRNPDIFLCNFEAPITNRNTIRSNRRAILKSDKKLLPLLHIGRINLLGLANNHITDYGDEGVIDTKKFVETDGFISIGAGKNSQEAAKPFFHINDDLKIVIIAISETGKHIGTISAKKDKPGANTYKAITLLQDIRKFKSKGYYIIITIHWGIEFISYPSPMQRNHAKQMIAHGADIILGHHPHIINGFEFYLKKPIFYSLGNFIFPQIRLQDSTFLKWPKYTRKTFCVFLELENNKAKINIDNYVINDHGIPELKQYNTLLIKSLNLPLLFYKYKIVYPILYLLCKTKHLLNKVRCPKKLYMDLKWKTFTQNETKN